LSDARVDALLASLRAGRSTTTTTEDDTPPTQPFTYAPVYYPGTPSISAAEALTLAAGQAIEGLDFQLVPSTTAAVEGQVLHPDGRPAANTSVQLILRTPPGRFRPDDALFVDTRADANGRFRLASVVTGEYDLYVRSPLQAPPPADPAGGMTVFVPGGAGTNLWAHMPLLMSGSDITGLTLALTAPRPVRGRVVFDGEADPPANLAQLRVGFTPVDGLTRTGVIRTIAFASPTTVGADGTFEFPNVPPGRFRFAIFGQALNDSVWVPASAQLGGMDLFDGIVDTSVFGEGEIVVTYVDEASELSGALTTATGEPFSDVFVIAFSTVRDHWGPRARRVQAVRPGVDGRYVVARLPPGDYFLAAVTDIDPDEWEDPAFLADLVDSAVRLSVGKGEKKVQDLRIGG
jgi:hypothetical protein